MGEEALLLPTDTYLKAGIHIGTKFKTRYMGKFIYKTRPDGLSVLNLQEIDRRMSIAAQMLANYEPQDILIISRREGSFKALKKMQELAGFKIFPGRYPPGVLTNPELENFLEVKIVFVSDPWTDRSAVLDAFRAGVPIIGCCDTNNQTNMIDLAVPCNNKGKKSLGIMFYLITREYMVKRGLIKNGEEFSAKIDDFTEE